MKLPDAECRTASMPREALRKAHRMDPARQHARPALTRTCEKVEKRCWSVSMPLRNSFRLAGLGRLTGTVPPFQGRMRRIRSTLILLSRCEKTHVPMFRVRDLRKASMPLGSNGSTARRTPRGVLLPRGGPLRTAPQGQVLRSNAEAIRRTSLEPTHLWSVKVGVGELEKSSDTSCVHCIGDE